jgi:prophage regulatory protein
MADKSLLRLPELLARTGLKRSTVLALMQRGAFPLPIKLGSRLNAWASNEVEDWVAQQIATRPRKTFTEASPTSSQSRGKRGRP